MRWSQSHRQNRPAMAFMNFPKQRPERVSSSRKNATREFRERKHCFALMYIRRYRISASPKSYTTFSRILFSKRFSTETYRSVYCCDLILNNLSREAYSLTASNFFLNFSSKAFLSSCRKMNICYRNSCMYTNCINTSAFLHIISRIVLCSC